MSEGRRCNAVSSRGELCDRLRGHCDKHDWANDAAEDKPSPGRGLRYNAGKAPLHYLPRAALLGVARVYEYGATKYDNHNWRKGMPWSESVACLLRHLLAYMESEDLDLCEEHKLGRPAEGCKVCSGLPHIDHVLWNALALSEFYHLRSGTDDRYRASGGAAGVVAEGASRGSHGVAPKCGSGCCACADSEACAPTAPHSVVQSDGG